MAAFAPTTAARAAYITDRTPVLAARGTTARPVQPAVRTGLTR